MLRLSSMLSFRFIVLSDFYRDAALLVRTSHCPDTAVFASSTLVGFTVAVLPVTLASPVTLDVLLVATANGTLAPRCRSSPT